MTASKDSALIDFFVAGGTLRANTPSYVRRAADDELYELALKSEFCYVLTPRQMGKSSLMVHTARRLQQQGIKTVIIDLTQIGTVKQEQWYLGFLSQLKRRLHLENDPVAWWQGQAALGLVSRFTTFLQDVVLAEIKEPVVIFIDEIDTTLKLDFRDDFFAAVRAMYNARATDPELQRLTFVLLGVASPSDLIKDRARTPFNIGHAIALTDFSWRDTQVLRQGLEQVFPGRGEMVFDRIFHWTNGHPYLTQKLCLAVVEERRPQEWHNDQIDSLVRRLFLSEEARKETNLQFVQDQIITHPLRPQLLTLYKRLLKGQAVQDDGQSILHNHIKLTGLVKAEHDQLYVRNHVYRQAFDLEWIRRHRPVNWPWLVSGAAVTISVIVVFCLILLVGYDNYWLPQQADSAEIDFVQTSEEEDRAAALVGLLSLDPLLGGGTYENRAVTLFYDLDTWEEQAGIYDPANFDRAEDLVLLAQTMYITLADVERSDETRPMLIQMSEALAVFVHDETAVTLKEEIDFWLQAREASYNGNWQQALNRYTDALALNDSNPATRYERAWVYVQTGEYAAALQDLDRVMGIALSQSDASEGTPVSEIAQTVLNPTRSTPTPTLFLAPTDSPSATPGIMATQNAGATATNVPTQNGDETSLPLATPSLSTPSATTTSNLPVSTPTPTEPIQSHFFTRAQRISAVFNLINSQSELVNYLAGSTAFPNLYSGGLSLIPTHTATPTVNTAATATATWLEDDTDSDGLINDRELELGTEPEDIDSDDDGLSDGDEVLRTGTEPTNFDTDGDGLVDGQEVNQGCTSPLNADTDGDGINDLADPEPCDFVATPTPKPTPIPTLTTTPDTGFDFNYFMQNCEYLDGSNNLQYSCRIIILPHGASGPFTVTVFDDTPPSRYENQPGNISHNIVGLRCDPRVYEILIIDEGTEQTISKLIFFDPKTAFVFPDSTACVLPGE